MNRAATCPDPPAPDEPASQAFGREYLPAQVWSPAQDGMGYHTKVAGHFKCKRMDDVVHLGGGAQGGGKLPDTI
jgi:hypothetical protein